MQVFITILGLTVPSYGLCIAAGMITANLAAFVLIRRRRMDGNDFIILEAYTILGAFLGAKLFYLWVSRTLIDWSRMADPAYFNEWMRGGFVFYGGLILGLASAFASGRIHRIDTMLYVKRFIFLIPWIHGFGRIGCFLAGCCYGIPWRGMFAVTFPAGCAAPFGTGVRERHYSPAGHAFSGALPPGGIHDRGEGLSVRAPLYLQSAPF